MIDIFDFEALNATSHMLAWLSEDPILAIRTEFEAMLSQQVPGSILQGLIVRGKPEWLTGAVPSEEDPNQAILVRTGVAFEFELSVKAPDGKVYDLNGVFTWVGVDLHDHSQAKQSVWLDLDGNLASFGSDGELKRRVYFA